MNSQQSPTTSSWETAIKCDSCDGVLDIKWYCKNCSASLCDLCKTKHKTDRFLGKHNIVLRTENVIRLLDLFKPEMCLMHRRREICGFCKDCSVTCCIPCIQKRHRQHNVITIDSTDMECKGKLISLVLDIQKQARLHVFRQSNRQEICSNEETLEEAKKFINDFRQKLKDTVDEACDEVMHQLYLQRTEQNNDMSCQSLRLQDFIDFIESGPYVRVVPKTPMSAYTRSEDQIGCVDQGATTMLMPSKAVKRKLRSDQIHFDDEIFRGLTKIVISIR